MTLRLFKRDCKVTLITPSPLPGAFFSGQPGKENAIEITGLRVAFSIEKHVKSDPNKCEVKIYNLAEITRGLCEKRPLTVRLDVGYDGALRLLFQGDVIRGFSELKKPEWETVLRLGDGDRACRLGRINKSYAAGTPLLSAVRDTASAMGLTLNASEVSRLQGLTSPFTGSRAVQGSARDELSRLVAPLGIAWSIQNGRLQLLRDGDVADGQAVLVSQDTGLIDTPEYTTPVKATKPSQLKFKMLLYPQLSPGSLVEVHSRAIKGKLFRIQKVVHRGDSWGKDWISEVEALPVSSTPNA